MEKTIGNALVVPMCCATLCGNMPTHTKQKALLVNHRLAVDRMVRLQRWSLINDPRRRRNCRSVRPPLDVGRPLANRQHDFGAALHRPLPSHPREVAQQRLAAVDAVFCYAAEDNIEE